MEGFGFQNYKILAAYLRKEHARQRETERERWRQTERDRERECVCVSDACA